MAEQYITVPFEADPSTLEQNVYSYIQDLFPGFAPKDTHLSVIFTEALMQEMATLIRLASDVPRDIFLYFGKLVGVEPKFSTPAVSNVQFTAMDTDGYTIPSGTAVRIHVQGDEYAAFVTVEDAVIPSGATTVQVGITALEEGARSSGLNGAIELLDVLDYISTVSLVAATTGGQDSEDIDEYLDRLAARLQLLADRPITPLDFEIYARTVSTVDRALAVDLYNPGKNEIQTIRVNNATGGDFNVTFEGQTTGAIAYNASAATIKTALEALSNIAPGEVDVTGGPVNTTNVVVEFKGALGKSNRTQMTSTSSLTGGGAAVAHATTQGGEAPASNQEKMVTLFTLDANGDVLSPAAKTELINLLQATREVNFVVHVDDPTFTAVTIATTVKMYSGYDVTSVHDSIEAALTTYLSPTRFNRPTFAEGTNLGGPGRDWVNDTKLRYLEVASVINGVGGVDYIESLTINGSAADLTLAGVAPLIAENPTLNVTVNI